MNNKKAFGNLLAAVSKLKTNEGKFTDANEGNWWKLEADKAGNGSAVIRPLPGKDDDSEVFIKYFHHGFKSSTGQWFIENCPTTLGNACPCCEENGVLWNSGVESNKAIVRERKRKTSHVINILVIKDPANPDNEGKVFLFKFGKSIFDKFTDAISPEDADEEGYNPFDPIEGANFKLKMRRVDGFANFDKSGFSDKSELPVPLSEIIPKLHDLTQFVAPEAFKSYDKLKERFDLVKGAIRQKEDRTVDEDDDASFAKSASTKAPVKTQSKPVDADEDDDLAYFQQLAND